MNDATVIEIGLQAMTVAAKLSAPILLTALLVGFLVSLFQSVTQIQEVTLSFVPKMLAIGIAILLACNWMLHELTTFTEQLYAQLPRMLSGG